MSTDRNDVPDAPARSLVAGVNWAAGPSWTINLDAQYVSEYVTLNPRFPGDPAPVGDFVTVNARCARRIALGAGRQVLKVFVAGENLGDRSYEYRPGYPMPGRSATLGVDWNF